METDETAVAAIRRFNRFHTRWVGALGGSLHSGLALAEARVLYELAQRDDWQAGEMAGCSISIRPISRASSSAFRAGLARTDSFGRRWACLRLRLTRRRAAFSRLDRLPARRRGDPAALAPSGRIRLVEALADTGACFRRAREPGPRSSASIAQAIWAGSWRPMAGSMPRITAGTSLRGARREIAAKFLREFKPGRERCFIAELDGCPRLGFVVQEDEPAKLRLVLVEKRAHGLGLGKRLSARRSASHATPAISAWCSGPTTSCMRAASMSVRGSSWWPRKSTIPSARTLSGRTGS
jgi:hypothetical protein